MSSLLFLRLINNKTNKTWYDLIVDSKDPDGIFFSFMPYHKILSFYFPFRAYSLNHFNSLLEPNRDSLTTELRMMWYQTLNLFKINPPLNNYYELTLDLNINNRN